MLVKEAGKKGPISEDIQVFMNDYKILISDRLTGTGKRDSTI